MHQLFIIIYAKLVTLCMHKGIKSPLTRNAFRGIRCLQGWHVGFTIGKYMHWELTHCLCTLLLHTLNRKEYMYQNCISQ